MAEGSLAGRAPVDVPHQHSNHSHPPRFAPPSGRETVDEGLLILPSVLDGSVRNGVPSKGL